MVKKRDDGLYDIPEANLYGMPEAAVPPNLRMAAVTPQPPSTDLYNLNAVAPPQGQDMRLAYNDKSVSDVGVPSDTQEAAPKYAAAPQRPAPVQSQPDLPPENPLAIPATVERTRENPVGDLRAEAEATTPAGTANPTGLHFGPTETEKATAPVISDPYQMYSDLNKMRGTAGASIPRKDNVFAGGVTTQEGPVAIPGAAPVRVVEKEPLPQAYSETPTEVYGASEIRRRIKMDKDLEKHPFEPYPVANNAPEWLRKEMKGKPDQLHQEGEVASTEKTKESFGKDVEKATAEAELTPNMRQPEAHEAPTEQPYEWVDNPRYNQKAPLSPENSPKVAVPKMTTPLEQAKANIEEAKANQFSSEREIADRKAQEQNNIGDVYQQAAAREKQMMDQAILDHQRRQAEIEDKQRKFEDITNEYLRRTKAVNPADMHPSFATALGQGLVYFGSLKAGHPIPAINWMNDEVNRNIAQQQREIDAYGTIAGMRINELGKLQASGMEPLTAQNVISAQMWQQASHQAQAMADKYKGSEYGDNLNKAADLMEQEALKKQQAANEANKKSTWQDIPAHTVAGKAPQTPSAIAEDEVRKSGVKFKSYEEFRDAVNTRRSELIQEGNAAALANEAVRRFPGKGPEVEAKRQLFLGKAYEANGITNQGIPQVNKPSSESSDTGPKTDNEVVLPESLYPEFKGKPVYYNNQSRAGLAALEKAKIIVGRSEQLRKDYDELLDLHRQYGASWATNRDARAQIDILAGAIENNLLALSQEGSSDFKAKTMPERTATDWASKIVTLADPEKEIKFAQKITSNMARSLVRPQDFSQKYKEHKSHGNITIEGEGE